MNYTLNDDTTLYIGTPFFDDNREGLTFGCEKLFNDNSNLDVSLFSENGVYGKIRISPTRKERSPIPIPWGLPLITRGYWGLR